MSRRLTVALNRKPGVLNQTVQNVLQLMTPQFIHRSVTLSQELNPLPEVSIDEDRVKQVVFNLLNNAANAMPEGGSIHVRTSCDQAAVYLSIEDSGPGVDLQDTRDLFESPQASASGLGIGLLVCKEIMDLHDGNITYRTSQNLGGACFIIAFPTA